MSQDTPESISLPIGQSATDHGECGAARRARHMAAGTIALGSLVAIALAAGPSIRPGEYAYTTTPLQASGEPAGKPGTVNGCITPEEAADPTRWIHGMLRQEEAEGCSPPSTQVTGNRVQHELRCKEDGIQSVFKMDVTYGPDWIKGRATVTVDGQVYSEALSARWIRAACSKESIER